MVMIVWELHRNIAYEQILRRLMGGSLQGKVS